MYYHNADEEFITFLLHGYITYNLREISENKKIEETFLEDLMNIVEGHELENISYDLPELLEASKGRMAYMKLHNKQKEGKSGGDFGLILSCPKIIIDEQCIRLQSNYSALLCQAKLKRKTNKWGEFTVCQKRALPE